MSDILVLNDVYSYDTVCPIPGHAGGSATLSSASPNTFVFIDGNLVVPIGTTHASNCPLGCKMTIAGTPQNFVTIENTLIACNSAQGNMGGCHPTVTVTSSNQNHWVTIG